MINSIISKKLAEQAEHLKEQLTGPLSEKYAEELRMYYEGTLHIISDDIENDVAELKSLAADKSRDTLFADFIQKTVIDEKTAIASLKTDLEKLFGEVKKDNGFETAGAMMIVYDWYYHYNSSATMMSKGFAYPIPEEPGSLSEVAPSLYLKNYVGPDFTDVWPDCSEVEEEDEDLGLTLMNYYQHHSRSLLHNALVEMDVQAELDFLTNRPFIFYITEHDCGVMALFVKE